MATTVISNRDITVGHVLCEGKRRIEVRSVTLGESCNGIHVNNTNCYNKACTSDVLVTKE